MTKDSYLRKLLTLFITFMKVGLFTFGGGYAMIPIIQDEVSTKKKWIKESEFLDIIAISESTPGPIAANTATYVGYRVAGVLGGIVATLGLAIPSFAIIFVISYFYKDFMEWKAVQAIFSGLKVGVILLLLNAVIKLKKGVKVSTLGIILFSVTLIATLAFSIFAIQFNYLSLCLIALGLIIGLSVTALSRKENKK